MEVPTQVSYCLAVGYLDIKATHRPSLATTLASLDSASICALNVCFYMTGGVT